MSLAKKIIIAAMILIVAIVGVIIFIGNKDTNDINEKLAQAAGYYVMMDYDKTIATYNSILSKDDSCVEAYIGLAEAYSAKGNNTKAIEILEQGVEAVGNDSRISDKISELSGVMIMSDTTDVSTAIATVTEAEPVTESVTVAPVEETTVPETVTTEETTVTTEEVTEETTKETTVTTEEVTEETTVTTEKPTISVPNFIGITKDEAASLAKRKNIKLEFEYEKNDTYPNGVVYYQSKREGTLVAPSTTVYAYVCVNDTEYVSEELKALRNFKTKLEKWADNGSVSIDEKNSVVTISVHSTKRFILDESVVNAMRKCDNATLCIVTDDYKMSIPTVSVANVSKLDLSSDYIGNYSRATFTIESGADSCDINVVLTNCVINSSDYENMKLYVNNKKPTTFDLTIDEEPILLVSTSGTYTIK